QHGRGVHSRRHRSFWGTMLKLPHALIVLSLIGVAFATNALAALPKGGARFHGTYEGELANNHAVSFKVSKSGHKIVGFEVQYPTCNGQALVNGTPYTTSYFSVGTILVR